MAFIAIAVAASHVKAGALRAIGLSSTTRSPLLPDLPTIAEQGLPNYALDGWVAVVGPAGSPKAEVERAYQGVRSGGSAGSARCLAGAGLSVAKPTPDATVSFFRSEVSRMARLVKQSGLKLD